MDNLFSNNQPDMNSDVPELDLNENDSPDDEVLSEPVDDWGGGELEAAYLKALSALEASEFEIHPAVEESPSRTELIENIEDIESQAERRSPRAPSQDGPPLVSEELNKPDSVPVSMNHHQVKSDAAPVPEFRPIPRQIIEACLFVGGETLTSTRLAGVLRGEFNSDYVDREIDELNRLYAAEGRPYEIRLGEGGYRLTLRDEFERIRHKVYGLGPKEVRLSQEALEVLAVIAYYQPITQARVEELGKPGCGAVVRQLVRRELIAVIRDPAHPKEVLYQTTPRFLSLFGIRNLDELPRPEQVSYK